jgi:hypothetical protein
MCMNCGEAWSPDEECKCQCKGQPFDTLRKNFKDNKLFFKKWREEIKTWRIK